MTHRTGAKTQAEAAQTWCPLSFAHEDAACCAGPKCMAWRTWQLARHEPHCASLKLKIHDKSMSAEAPLCNCQMLQSTGYCGLAGNP